MAKFCTKCGSSLEEGKTCKCEKKEVSNFSNLLKEYIDVVKSIFKKPINVLKEKNNEEKFNLGLLSIGITSILVSIVVCLIMKSIMVGVLYGLVEIPYIKIFLLTFIISCLTISSLSLISYLLINKIFKGETSIKKMFVLFGISSIYVSITALIAILLLLIDINFSIVSGIILIGGLLYLTNITTSLKHYSKINENFVGYIITTTSITTYLIIYFIIAKIFIKI